MSSQPKQLSNREWEKRQIEYLASLRQLKRLTDKKGWKIFVCENTVLNCSEIKNQELVAEVSLHSFTSLPFNSGETNKGIGELDMLVGVFREHSKLLRKFDAMSYFTGRRFMPNSFLIDRSESLRKGAIISNPNFLLLDGTTIPSKKEGLYNDMFFTMKNEVIVNYIKYYELNRSYFIREGIGSEQILYKYINEFRISFEWIEQLGLIRRETTKIGLWSRKNQIQIC